MLPSQAAMIFSIAISVCLDAILDPCVCNHWQYPWWIGAKFSALRRTFGGVVGFPQLAYSRLSRTPLTTGLRALCPRTIARALARFRRGADAGFGSCRRSARITTMRAIRGQQPMRQIEERWGRLVDGADKSVSRSFVSRLDKTQGKDASGRWKVNAFRRSVEQ